MPSREAEEKLRKLAPVEERKADLSWLFYLSSEGEERQAADELFDIFLFQRIKKDYREKIFIDPQPSSDCFGEYFLGMAIYPSGRPYCPFGKKCYRTR